MNDNNQLLPNANKAYAHGALDGYNIGENNNPYCPTTEANRHQAYKSGYDYGIFLYTQDNEGK